MKTLNRKMTIQPGLELKAVKELGNEDSDNSFSYESSDSESSSGSCNRILENVKNPLSKDDDDEDFQLNRKTSTGVMLRRMTIK